MCCVVLLSHSDFACRAEAEFNNIIIHECKSQNARAFNYAGKNNRIY